MSNLTFEQVTAAKEAGQRESLRNATRDDVLVALSALREVEAGASVSANTLRPALDAAGIKEGRRAGLMRQLCAMDLLCPVMLHVPGEGLIQVGVPSRGKTAKGAYVKLYTRTSVPVPSPSSVSLGPP